MSFETKKNVALVDMLQARRKCKRSSCRTYASTLMRIHREFSKRNFNLNLKWLSEDADKILKGIKKLASVNVKRNLLGAGLVGLSVTKDEKNSKLWIEYLKKLNEQKIQFDRSGELTAKQKTNWIEWPQIIRLRKQLTRQVNLSKLYQRVPSKKGFSTMQQNLILSMLTLLPGVARREYPTLRFITKKAFEALPDKTGQNWLITGPKYKIIYQDYKTARTYKAVSILVPEHSKVLQRLLVKHVRWLKSHFPENDFLFLTQSYSPMTRNAFTKFLQRLFRQHFGKKNVSTTMLRHIFLSHKYSKSALDEQENTAKFMMHSPAMQREYVKRPPK